MRHRIAADPLPFSYVPDLGLVYCKIYKNASTALYNLIRENHTNVRGLMPEEVGKIDASYVTMWREPHQRMESAYKFLTNDYRNAEPLKFSDYVLAVCNGSIKDKHLTSQTEHSTWYGRFLPDIIIRWDFGEFQRLFRIEQMRKANETRLEPLQWTDEALEAFTHAYADDLRIWNG